MNQDLSGRLQTIYTRILYHERSCVQDSMNQGLSGTPSYSPHDLQVVRILDELRQTMDYQRYLMRSCQYRVMLEVLSPYQFTILVVSPQS